MRKVRVIYDPILRQVAAPVTVFNEPLKKLSIEMLEVMHRNIGMGLAANQLGEDRDLLVIEYRPAPDSSTEHEVGSDQDGSHFRRALKPFGPLALCNAKLVKTSQEVETMNEGCLSVPKLELEVTRPSGVTVEAQDLTGKPITLKVKGLLARILQHEIDHLDGILFTDRAKGVKNIKNYTWANIVFIGSDQFSVVILESLITAGLNVTAVITETDKRSGRGNSITSPVVKKFADHRQIAVFQPETKEDLTAALQQLKPDLVILASYGKILPERALEIPIYGALNVHPSLLPKYRGATPLQSTILNGDGVSGVTVMKMNAGVDTGEIVSQASAPIALDETFVSLRDKLATIGSQLLLKTLPIYLAGLAKIKNQSGVATQTIKLTKAMGEIDWNQSADFIDRQIRALNPWPSTFTFVGEKRLKILDANINEGKLTIKTVQLEGKNPTAWADFIKGHQEQLKKCSWYDKIS